MREIHQKFRERERKRVREIHQKLRERERVREIHQKLRERERG